MKNNSNKGFGTLQILFYQESFNKEFHRKEATLKFYKNPHLILHRLYKHVFTNIFTKKSPADKLNYIELLKAVIKEMTCPVLCKEYKQMR